MIGTDDRLTKSADDGIPVEKFEVDPPKTKVVTSTTKKSSLLTKRNGLIAVGAVLLMIGMFEAGRRFAGIKPMPLPVTPIDAPVIEAAQAALH